MWADPRLACPAAPAAAVPLPTAQQCHTAGMTGSRYFMVMQIVIVICVLISAVIVVVKL